MTTPRPAAGRRRTAAALAAPLLATVLGLALAGCSDGGERPAASSPRPTASASTATSSPTPPPAPAPPAATASTSPAAAPAAPTGTTTVVTGAPPAPAPAAPGAGGRRTVAPVITYAEQTPGTSLVQVSAFVPEVVEGGGSCTATLSVGALSAETGGPSTPDAASTICGGLEIDVAGLPPGTGTVTVHYLSPGSQGSSQPVTLEVAP